MPRTTVTLDDDHADILATVRSEHSLDSRAAAVRWCIGRHPELHEAESRVHELRTKLEAANSRIDASNELVRAVEREQTLAERRAKAGLGTKLKWAVFGMDED